MKQSHDITVTLYSFKMVFTINKMQLYYWIINNWVAKWKGIIKHYTATFKTAIGNRISLINNLELLQDIGFYGKQI